MNKKTYWMYTKMIYVSKYIIPIFFINFVSLYAIGEHEEGDEHFEKAIELEIKKNMNKKQKETENFGNYIHCDTKIIKKMY